MQRHDPRRFGVVLALALVSLAWAAGAASSATKKKPKGIPPKVKETVGDVASFFRAAPVKVEGVGLIIGLAGTGSDAPVGAYRDMLLDQMRKANVDHPDKILKDPTTSLVLVRAFIPIGQTLKDKVDLEIELPPGSTTKSLVGGRLIEARLTEVLKGRDNKLHQGAPWVIGDGPILTGNLADPNNPKVGKVLGGGRIKKEFPYVLVVKENRRSIHTSSILMNVINQRFHQHKGVDEEGMVSARDVKEPDRHLYVKVPSVYHQNQPRFFQVVKMLPMVDSPELQKQRLEEWRKPLLEAKTTAKTALRLEAMGPNSADLLKEGLTNKNEQVQFFCAEALAYLHDGAGADVLAENAVKRVEFRAFAMAALAAMDQPPGYMALKKLMGEPDIKVRYGAFNALRTVDAHDPALGRIRVLSDPSTGPRDDDDAMAFRAKARRARLHSGDSRFTNDPFELYLVDSDGPPLVHVSTTRRCELVVFGMGQRLLPPLVLGGGGNLMVNASDGDETIQVSRISTHNLEDPGQKLMVPSETESVIRAMAQLGGTYPEIVTVLLAAQKQKNLPGPLAFDAVPEPDEAYLKAVILGEDATAKKDSGLKRTSAEESKGHGIRDWFRKKMSGD